MPRREVRTYYRKAERHKGRRSTPSGSQNGSLVRPEGVLSRLSRYIDENADSGMTREELHEQFHEYDCPEEKFVELSRSPNKVIYHCPQCRYVVVNEIA